MQLFRNSRIIRYIFFEMLPGFFLGVSVFLAIILMFQVLRLTEFALVHGVDIKSIGEIIGYICISMLPALIPMSLLFSILMTYGRLSTDSEIVAMKASGVSMVTIAFPAIFLATLVGIISAQTSFEIAPWGNRQFEVLLTKMSNMKAGATIKEGTFSEGFFDMVLYANEVNSDQGILKKIFIYDESKGDVPLTIVAKEGRITPDPDAPGHKVLLRLENGDIHRKAENHTKIKFKNYDIVLIDPIKNENREKSPQSYTLQEIQKALTGTINDKELQTTLQAEFHKRWAISFLCFVFAILGVGVGTTTDRRSAKSNGLILCIGLIVIYWILYIVCEGAARSGQLPASVVIWIPNILYLIFGLETLRRKWN